MKRKSRKGAEGTNLTSLSSVYIFFIATRPMAELVAAHPQHSRPFDRNDIAFRPGDFF
ncbi:hypothetical protein N183_11045 [Sinorhizobium sp. Sb3]|nr:hypothetical protein N183_11045 [Sinorhizobium sp. Sb3]